MSTLVDMLGTRFGVVCRHYAPDGEIVEGDFQNLANFRTREHLSHSIVERKLEI